MSIRFLAWLADRDRDRDRDRDLPSASQHDIDAWLARGPSTRKHAAKLMS